MKHKKSLLKIFATYEYDYNSDENNPQSNLRAFHLTLSLTKNTAIKRIIKIREIQWLTKLNSINLYNNKFVIFFKNRFEMCLYPFDIYDKKVHYLVRYGQSFYDHHGKYLVCLYNSRFLLKNNV